MKSFKITNELLDQYEWSLTRPLLIVYTQLKLLSIQELQFKLLYENEIDIPRHLQVSIFGDKLSSISKKGSLFNPFYRIPNL
jgi:hypothetical protein